MVWTLTKDGHFETTYLPRLVNVVCEWPQRRWLGVSGGNPIHGLSSCVKVHRQKAQLGTTFTFPLLLLAIIQKRTQYLCYGLLKKKWKWRIVWGQDRTVGPKLSLFSKNVWLDNRFFKLSLIVFSSFTQIFERTIVFQNVLELPWLTNKIVWDFEFEYSKNIRILILTIGRYSLHVYLISSNLWSRSVRNLPTLLAGSIIICL